jgi:two-component system cell cycle response regulator DivK
MKKTILIADDDAKYRKLLTDVLQADGYATLTAEDGKCAIELARSARPNLILMDIQMPLIDGLTIVKALKAEPDMESIPVIAITALAMHNDRERMLEAGFDGYLSKPISIKELRLEVNRHLGAEPKRNEKQRMSPDKMDLSAAVHLSPTPFGQLWE